VPRFSVGREAVMAKLREYGVFDEAIALTGTPHSFWLFDPWGTPTVTRNGSACGRRSAWRRQGGYAPICYEREITADAVRARIEWTRQSPARITSAPQSG
jgi:hypothetical protein